MTKMITYANIKSVHLNDVVAVANGGNGFATSMAVLELVDIVGPPPQHEAIVLSDGSLVKKRTVFKRWPGGTPLGVTRVRLSDATVDCFVQASSGLRTKDQHDVDANVSVKVSVSNPLLVSSDHVDLKQEIEKKLRSCVNGVIAKANASELDMSRLKMELLYALKRDKWLTDRFNLTDVDVVAVVDVTELRKAGVIKEIEEQDIRNRAAQNLKDVEQEREISKARELEAIVRATKAQEAQAALEMAHNEGRKQVVISTIDAVTQMAISGVNPAEAMSALGNSLGGRKEAPNLLPAPGIVETDPKTVNSAVSDTDKVQPATEDNSPRSNSPPQQGSVKKHDFKNLGDVLGKGSN